MSYDGRLIIGNKRLDSPEKIISKNPATLEKFGEASLASAELCGEAVGASVVAYPGWRDMPVGDKKRIFRKAQRILLDRREEAARLITLEKGSPYLESLAVEVMGSLGVLEYYTRHMDESLRPKKVSASVPLFAHKKNVYHFQAIGPTLIISPWNFPLLIPFCDIVSSLSAGNSVVHRPSTSTPLTALFLGEIFVEAGLPPGVLNVVVCRTAQAEDMITNARIQTVMFTGSVGTGKRVMELASRNLTNIILELGGKDPMIVLKDADLERAARGAVWTAFMNCGQSCASIERAYVAREVVEPFTARCVELARQIKVGNPLEPGVDMGPMTTLSQLQTVEEHLRDARDKGARILTGGDRVKDLPGYFLSPAVLDRVDHTMKIMTEETFGPTLPIMSFSTVEDAVALANDSSYGLTASVWTRSRKAAAAIAERLEVGSVTVNDHMFSFTEPKAIWGGPKQTGAGRSHGPYGLLHLQNIKYVSSEFLRKKSQLWWFPYGPPKPRVIDKALVLMHGQGAREKFRALGALLPSLKMVLRSVSVRSLLKIVGRFLKNRAPDR